MSIICCSMWYADAGKHLVDRALHLFSKAGVERWIFSVRPAKDWTEHFLSQLAAATGRDCDVLMEDWPQPEARIERLSLAGDSLLEEAAAMDCEYVLWHESDLFSPIGIASSLRAIDGAAVGGWPWLSHCPDAPSLGVHSHKRMALDEPMFYDTWGYRKDGVRFGNKPPHHACHRPDEPYQLDSVGSVVLIKADYLRRGARMNGNGLVGLCESIRGLGGTVWCDPRVPVVQPLELWTLNDD